MLALSIFSHGRIAFISEKQSFHPAYTTPLTSCEGSRCKAGSGSAIDQLSLSTVVIAVVPCFVCTRVLCFLSNSVLQGTHKDVASADATCVTTGTGCHFGDFQSATYRTL